MKKLAIVYGFIEGPLIGKSFADECRRRGFEIVNSVENADVIVAHSGGWMFLPENFSDKKLVLINVGHRSKGSIMRQFHGRNAYDIENVVFSKQSPIWLYLRVLNSWYLATKFTTWLEMRRRFYARDASPIISQPNVTVIQSADRSWYDAEVMTRARNIITLDSGCHDDCWYRPHVYLDIIDRIK